MVSFKLIKLHLGYAIINFSYAMPLCRYEMQDLHVAETLPQMFALSEAYMQIYELQQ